MAQLFEDCYVLRHSYYEALGHITFECSHLERNIERLIWGVSKIGKKYGRLLITPLGVRFKYEGLKIVAEKSLKDRNIKAKIVRICAQAKKISEQRNKYIHGVWKHPLTAKGKINKRMFVLMTVAGSGSKRWLPRAQHITTRKMLAFANRAKTLNRRADKLFGLFPDV